MKSLDARAGIVRNWSLPGLLCIGDAAHPMSPIAGVGINLAVQDAIAAARLLADPLRHGRLTHADLQSVQHRRMLATKLTRGFQDTEHRQVVEPALAGRINGQPLPAYLRMMQLHPRISGLLTWLQLSIMGNESTPDFARRPSSQPLAQYRTR